MIKNSKKFNKDLENFKKCKKCIKFIGIKCFFEKSGEKQVIHYQIQVNNSNKSNLLKFKCMNISCLKVGSLIKML